MTHSNLVKRTMVPTGRCSASALKPGNESMMQSESRHASGRTLLVLVIATLASTPLWAQAPLVMKPMVAVPAAPQPGQMVDGLDGAGQDYKNFALK